MKVSLLAFLLFFDAGVTAFVTSPSPAPRRLDALDSAFIPTAAPAEPYTGAAAEQKANTDPLTSFHAATSSDRPVYPGVQDIAGNYVAPMQGPGAPAPAPARVVEPEATAANSWSWSPPPAPPNPPQPIEMGTASTNDNNNTQKSENEEQEDWKEYYSSWEDYNAEKERTRRKLMKLIEKGFHEDVNENEARNALNLAQLMMRKHKHSLPQGTKLLKEKEEGKEEKKMNDREYDGDERESYYDDPYYDDPYYNLYEEDDYAPWRPYTNRGDDFRYDPRTGHYYPRMHDGTDNRDRGYAPGKSPRRRPDSHPYFQNSARPYYPNNQYNDPRFSSPMFGKERRQQGDIFQGPQEDGERYDARPRPISTPRQQPQQSTQHYAPPQAPGYYRYQPQMRSPPPPPQQQWYPAPQQPGQMRLTNGRSVEEQMRLRQTEAFIEGSGGTYFSPGNYGGAI